MITYRIVFILFFLFQLDLAECEINVTTELTDRQIVAGTPFILKISVSSDGKIEDCTFKPSQLNLPEEIKQLNVRQESKAVENIINVYFVYELQAEKSGDYFIEPQELKYQKQNQDFSIMTKKIHISVGKKGDIVLSKKLLLIICFFIIISLLVIGFIIIKRK